jgi:hypothetical protein
MSKNSTPGPPTAITRAVTRAGAGASPPVAVIPLAVIIPVPAPLIALSITLTVFGTFLYTPQTESEQL